MSVSQLRDVGPNYERALAILERLHNEAPEHLEQFLDWIARPIHSQEATLVFRDSRLIYARIEATSIKKRDEAKTVV